MKAYPKEFYCPITQEIMDDPVIGPDGHTYERLAIEDWLKSHSTSPLTRMPLSSKQLIPNIALRNTIQEIISGKKEPLPEISAPGKADDPTLSIALHALRVSDSEGVLHVAVKGPESGVRKPCLFVCLLDTSGSMGESASIKKGVEDDGLSRLDLVKHSVKTIAHMMSSSDYLALISFSDSAKVLMEISKMDSQGKTFVEANLDQLEPDRSTNIWDALRVGIGMIRSSPIALQCNTSVLLFTDGEPNINPPRGIIPTLVKYLEGKSNPFIIHSFGYGYSLDSELLSKISEIGAGIFCYIPDSTMMGTTFVNHVSNSLCVAVNNMQLELHHEGLKSFRPLGCEMSAGRLEVGSAHFGQTRDFIFTFHAEKYQAFNVEVVLKYGAKNISAIVNSMHTEGSAETWLQYGKALYVQGLVDNIHSANSGKIDSSLLTALYNRLKMLPCASGSEMKCILRDISSSKESEGQVMKSFSNADWFKKWGKHYIRSLVRAHQVQQCHNFKDPSVQIYGGKMFRDLQDKTDEIFTSLPPPKPSKVKPVAFGAPASLPIDMHDYLDYNAGCFDGSGLL